MTFIVNGIIRSLTDEEMAEQLREVLIGKKVSILKNKIYITDVTTESNLLYLHHKHDYYTIKGIDKIEIDHIEKLLRIFSKDRLYIIQFLDENKP